MVLCCLALFDESLICNHVHVHFHIPVALEAQDEGEQWSPHHSAMSVLVQLPLPLLQECLQMYP